MTLEVPDLRVGRVVNTHGFKGTVQVEPLTDFPARRFARGSHLLVGGRVLTVASSDGKSSALLITFEEVTNREEASRLKGAYITVPLSEAQTLPKGKFYHFELVGLPVYDLSTKRQLGTVAEVLAYEANDVLRVTGGSREVLVPMVQSVVRSIEPDQGRILVDMPEETEA